jgi:hypothetical protein
MAAARSNTALLLASPKAAPRPQATVFDLQETDDLEAAAEAWLARAERWAGLAAAVSCAALVARLAVWGLLYS